MKKVAESDQRNYEIVKEVENVLVRIPKENFYMEEVGEHTFELHGETIKVSRHWRNGFFPPGTKEIVNRHYFDLDENDLGSRIVATVHVVKKTTRDGRVFTMLDFFKTPNQEPIFDMKFSHNGEGGLKIQFRER